MIFPAVDGYLREQDLLNLRASDVSVGDNQVILFLGRSERGDRSKTGRNQGVSLDSPYAHDVLRRRIAGLRPSDRVFPITANQYRSWWTRAAKAVLKTSSVPPPHSARHTGASRDLAEGYRTFEQVQRRGRWSVPSSVQRYAKTHTWRAVELSVPEAVREEGNRLLNARARRPTRPQE
jgi:integrase